MEPLLEDREIMRRMWWRMGVVFMIVGGIMGSGGLVLQARRFGWVRIPADLMMMPVWAFASVSAAGMLWVVRHAWKEGAFDHFIPMRGHGFHYVGAPAVVMAFYCMTDAGRWEGLLSFVTGLALVFCGWKAMHAELPENPDDVKPWF